MKTQPLFLLPHSMGTNSCTGNRIIEIELMIRERASLYNIVRRKPAKSSKVKVMVLSHKNTDKTV